MRPEREARPEKVKPWKALTKPSASSESEWCRFNRYLMEERGVSQGVLAAALSKKLGRDGFTQACISSYCTGRTRPPLELLDPWADALSLTGSDREKFIFFGVYAHIPDRLRAMIESLRRLAVKRDAKIKELEDRLTAQAAELAKRDERITALLLRQANLEEWLASGVQPPAP